MSLSFDCEHIPEPCIADLLSLPPLPPMMFSLSSLTSLTSLPSLPMFRCTSNPLVRGYSNISVTSDEGAHFIPYGRGQSDLLQRAPSPVSHSQVLSPMPPVGLGQFRFDAQAVQSLNTNTNPISQGNITPMSNIYVTSKVPLGPIADVSECEHESRTEPTERTYVSSAMTGTCSNATPAPTSHGHHDQDDEAEAEAEADVESIIADAQLNVEAMSFVPNMAGFVTPTPNSGFVAPVPAPNNSIMPSMPVPVWAANNQFGLNGLPPPHPNEFRVLPQMHAQPTLPQMQPAPPTAAASVQGSPTPTSTAPSTGYSQVVRNYMDSTQPQQQQQQTQGFRPHQNQNQNIQRGYTPGASQRNAPPRRERVNLNPNMAQINCERVIRDLKDLDRSSPTALPRLVEQELVVAFMCDQTGSRYLQEKLEVLQQRRGAAPPIAHAHVDAVLHHIIFDQRAMLRISEEKYGNYVVQALIKMATPEQLTLFMKHLLRGNVHRLSRHFYACRVIQEALVRVCDADCIALVAELEAEAARAPGTRLIRDCILCDNGNHVIQKMLQLGLEMKHVRFIVDTVDADINYFAAQNYGCRIVQNIIEGYGDHDNGRMLRQMVAEHCLLQMSMSQYGNYVIQHILELATCSQRVKDTVMRNVFASVCKLAMDKSGSNVVESCIECASQEHNQEHLEFLLNQILDRSDKQVLYNMCHHRYGNYTIQKLLVACNATQTARLIGEIECRVPDLKGSNCGKHVAAKMNRVRNGGNQRRNFGGARGGKGRGGWGQNQNQNQKRGGRGGRGGGKWRY